MAPRKVELGLGIISLGKLWGYVPGEVPTERQAIELLEFAFETGIRYFDSAPSYGIAEERLGKFLHSLSRVERDQLCIATKFGEHWDAGRNQPYVDHCFDALRQSVDGSLRHLGRIDILQLHKTTPEALRSADLGRAWDYAAQLGIAVTGASVSDLESARMVIAEPRYSVMQLPFNRANSQFSGPIAEASARVMRVVTNRPFGMGAMLYGESPVTHEEAFRLVLQGNLSGVILNGTKSKTHLRENWEAFHAALALTA